MLCCADPDWAVGPAIENLEGNAPFRYVGATSTGCFPDAVPRYGDSAARGECRIESRTYTYIRAVRGMISHQNIRRTDRRFDHTAPSELSSEPVLNIDIQVRIKHRRSGDPRLGLEFREICRLLVLDLDLLCFSAQNEWQQKNQH